MNRFLFGVARAVTETFSLPEPIVEIGSYQVEGQNEVYLRNLFPDRDYIGVQGLVTFYALFVVVVSLLIDVVSAWVDPRIRYGR